MKLQSPCKASYWALLCRISSSVSTRSTARPRDIYCPAWKEARRGCHPRGPLFKSAQVRVKQKRLSKAKHTVLPLGQAMPGMSTDCKNSLREPLEKDLGPQIKERLSNYTQIAFTFPDLRYDYHSRIL